MDYQIIKTEQKALEINLDSKIYGTFAEIGAGQEVARFFFQVGAAAGTIAKTMSAYDKTYSDAIYGEEGTGRYVCESRVYKMLDHEYGLMDERLKDVRPNTKFFVFADTVAAINYHRTIKGQGWLGVRFQLESGSPPNQVVIHTKMLDNDNKQQQEAIGVLGVNLIYACYRYHKDPQQFIKSLIESLVNRIEIDMIHFSGPDFATVDNRLMCLYLVKNHLTPVAIFNEEKNGIHASEFLYKKHLIVVRGHFQPPTKVTMDVIDKSYKQFKKQEGVIDDKAFMITELTLGNLETDGNIDERDFLSRADMLCAMGHKVIISNCENHQKLISYLEDYKIQNLALVIGVRELYDIIEEKYYSNQDGRLLVAFGELFTKNIKVYVYPALEDNKKVIMTAENLRVPEGIKFLYKHLIDTKQIVGIEDYNANMLNVFPTDVYDDICSGNDGWQAKVPSSLVKIIQNKGLFCYIDKRK